MERRNHQEMGNNPVGYTPPSHESPSPVKLPLAPLLSTPPDNHRRPNAVPSARRGSSIFSPAHHHHHHQTLDHHHAFNAPRPPPPHHQLSPIDDASASPDPDPTTPTTAAPSKSKSPPPPAAENTSSIRYRECLKNHAASMGAHVVDGCGEFMPSGEDGAPDGLRCAACDCHRNFHRKESDADRTPPQNLRPGTAQQPRHRFASPAGMVSFGGAAAESSSGHAAGRHSSGSKKRFRTKFNQDQKDRMQEFAAKVGWRIQKEDEEEVERFCGEVGVKRQVFKVWMHNNKQAIKKRSAETSDL